MGPVRKLVRGVAAATPFALLVASCAREPQPQIVYAAPPGAQVYIAGDGFCPDGITIVGRSKRYCFIREEVPWAQAIEGCARRSKRLASVTDAYDNDALIRILSGQFPDLKVWVGVGDGQREGDFRRLDGTPPSFLNWRPGEPNDDNKGEDCVEWILPGGGLNDLPCGLTRPYLCE